jgi:hypothetical protein
MAMMEGDDGSPKIFGSVLKVGEGRGYGTSVKRDRPGYRE